MKTQDLESLRCPGSCFTFEGCLGQVAGYQNKRILFAGEGKYISPALSTALIARHIVTQNILLCYMGSAF